MKSLQAEGADLVLQTCRRCKCERPMHEFNPPKSANKNCRPCQREMKKIVRDKVRAIAAAEQAERAARFDINAVAKPAQNSILDRGIYDPGASRAFFRNDGHKAIKSRGQPC
jgi:hypothetical protein